MGLRKHLSTAEIVEQAVFARRLFSDEFGSITNVVFMVSISFMVANETSYIFLLPRGDNLWYNIGLCNLAFACHLSLNCYKTILCFIFSNCNWHGIYIFSYLTLFSDSTTLLLPAFHNGISIQYWYSGLILWLPLSYIWPS
jgi:hypothetical protein